MRLFVPKTYTVESVTEGHPDKVCDQISDAILDACLTEDPGSRVAAETFGSHGLLVLGGEVTTLANVDYEAVARGVYKDIGYQDDLEVRSHIAEQSPEIAQGVNPGGAGDQGIMYGYATDETPEYLPKGVVIAHAMTKKLAALRKDGTLPWLMPDGKSQVTISNDEVMTLLVSTQHTADVEQADIEKEVKEQVMSELVGNAANVTMLVNPTGMFVQGGFEADAGLTGRKIMVDTYGGLIPHGGGAFSGKDSTKVDRSAAYMCRFVAKNIVAKGLAHKCLVSVAYAIGVEEPLMVVAFDEDGNEIAKDELRVYDFRPRAIIERLGLQSPIFRQTAAYGHFGNEDYPWENLAI